MRLIPKSSKRIGIAKKELSQYDYSDFDEIDISALFSKDDLL